MEEQPRAGGEAAESPDGRVMIYPFLLKSHLGKF